MELDIIGFQHRIDMTEKRRCFTPCQTKNSMTVERSAFTSQQFQLDDLSISKQYGRDECMTPGTVRADLEVFALLHNMKTNDLETFEEEEEIERSQCPGLL